MAYHRVYVISPLMGAGKANDAKRPIFVPAQQPQQSSRSALLGYQMQLSDDGQFALAEFVFSDPAAFVSVMKQEALSRNLSITLTTLETTAAQSAALTAALETAVPGLKIFERGKVTDAQILAEFQKHKAKFAFAGTTVRPQ